MARKTNVPSVRRGRRIAAHLVPPLVVFSPAALAAGESLPSLVQDVGVSLLAAGALAVAFARIHIPSIAAFLLAGAIIGPVGLGLVTDPVNIDTIAQLGFIFLLFLIGLEIDVKRILASGRSIVLSGLLQYPLTVLFGMLAVKLMLWLGVGGGLLAESPYAAVYIGVVIAGSSTLLVVKLFQENFELDTEPGRLALGVLILQDIWIIVAIIIQPSFQHPDFSLILMSFLGILLLCLLALIVAWVFAGRAFASIAKQPELAMTAALAWCFAVVFVGVNLDALFEIVYGRSFHMAVGSGMAALIAGASIASLPSSTEIITKVTMVKDFFITLFFVALGISIPPPQSLDVLVLALAIAAVAILARQLVFFPLFYFARVDQRNAQVSATRLAQISEFGLVFAFLGVKLGHLSPEFSSAVIFSFVFTALATPLLYHRAYEVHGWLQPLLEKLGFRAPPELAERQDDAYRLVLLGFYRDASSLLYNLQQTNPGLLQHTLVVDFNVALHDAIRRTGAQVQYADLANAETLAHLGLDRAEVIVCTIPDDLLRGISNRSLVKTLREMCPTARIIANSVSLDQVGPIYAAGADWVYQARLEAARALAEGIEAALAGRIGPFREQRMQQNLYSPGRREVLG